MRNPTGTDYSSILSNRAQSSEKEESKSVCLSEGMLQSDLWQELLEYSKEQVEDAFSSETDLEDSAHADATFVVPSSAGNSTTATFDRSDGPANLQLFASLETGCPGQLFLPDATEELPLST